MRLATTALICTAAASLLCTVLLGGLGDSLKQALDARVQRAIRQQIVWQPDSPPGVQARFQNDTNAEAPPVLIKFYFFNITNVEGVRAGERPVLQELGPYTFLKHRQKLNVTFSPDGQRVSFQEYAFHLGADEGRDGDERGGGGARGGERAGGGGGGGRGRRAGAPPSMDDRVTTLNIPLAGKRARALAGGAALEAIIGFGPSAAAKWLELLAGLVEKWGDHQVQGLFTTRTVGELLWGYEDPLLKQAARLLPGVDPTFRLVGNMSGPEEAAAAPPTVVNTGAADLARVWDYEQWQGVSELTCWAPPHVERVRGTDAFQFRPGLALNDSLVVWTGELFRAAALQAEEQVELGGLPLLRLRPDPSQAGPDPRYFQYVRGLMNVTSPLATGPHGAAGSRPGPPVFLSYPHFCGADPGLAAGVVGVACDPERHALFVDVEPMSGITVRAAKRLQMNSWFGPRWAAVDARLRATYLPVFWAEESSQATPEQLRGFAPLLRARALARFLDRWARPLAAAGGVLGILSVLLLTFLAVPPPAGPGAPPGGGGGGGRPPPGGGAEAQDSCSVQPGGAAAGGGAGAEAGEVVQRLRGAAAAAAEPGELQQPLLGEGEIQAVGGAG
eukprot:scaffold1.g5592.t1